MDASASGFDPSTIDPAWIAQFSQMMNQLPKGQLNRLQDLMQKAMRGKDVSQDAQGLEGELPTELQAFLMNAPWANATPSETQAVEEAPPETPSRLKGFFSKFSGAKKR
jgi:hypothetical protein